MLHDLFGMPFEQIADIVDRSPAATRQLASRARRRVRSADAAESEPGPHAAARGRQRLPRRGARRRLRGAARDARPRRRADGRRGRRGHGRARVLRGPDAVAQRFNGGARSARLAAFDGGVGAVWTLRGEPRWPSASPSRGPRHRHRDGRRPGLARPWRSTTCRPDRCARTTRTRAAGSVSSRVWQRGCVRRSCSARAGPGATPTSARSRCSPSGASRSCRSRAPRWARSSAASRRPASSRPTPSGRGA